MAKILLSRKFKKRETELENPDEIKGFIDEATSLYLEEQTAYADGTESIVVRIDLPKQK